MSTVNVYLTEYSALNKRDIYAVPEQELASGLWYCDPENAPDSWVLVGTAEVHITLHPRAEVVSAQVDSLRKQQAEIRADAEVKANRIEQQIAKLLCIENSTEAA